MLSTGHPSRTLPGTTVALMPSSGPGEGCGTCACRTRGTRSLPALAPRRRMAGKGKEGRQPSRGSGQRVQCGKCLAAAWISTKESRCAVCVCRVSYVELHV